MNRQLNEYASGLEDLRVNLMKLHNRNMGCEVGEVDFANFYSNQEHYERALTLAREDLLLNADYDRYIDWITKN